jgi:hypothetical protein
MIHAVLIAPTNRSTLRIEVANHLTNRQKDEVASETIRENYQLVSSQRAILWKKKSISYSRSQSSCAVRA